MLLRERQHRCVVWTQKYLIKVSNWRWNEGCHLMRCCGYFVGTIKDGDQKRCGVVLNANNIKWYMSGFTSVTIQRCPKIYILCDGVIIHSCGGLWMFEIGAQGWRPTGRRRAITDGGRVVQHNWSGTHRKTTAICWVRSCRYHFTQTQRQLFLWTVSRFNGIYDVYDGLLQVILQK